MEPSADRSDHIAWRRPFRDWCPAAGRMHVCPLTPRHSDIQHTPPVIFDTSRSRPGGRRLGRKQVLRQRHGTAGHSECLDVPHEAPMSRRHAVEVAVSSSCAARPASSRSPKHRSARAWKRACGRRVGPSSRTARERVPPRRPRGLGQPAGGSGQHGQIAVGRAHAGHTPGDNEQLREYGASAAVSSSTCCVAPTPARTSVTAARVAGNARPFGIPGDTAAGDAPTMDRAALGSLRSMCGRPRTPPTRRVPGSARRP
jgi:hypothetical protein